MTNHAGSASSLAGRVVGGAESWALRSVTKSFTVTLILQMAEEGLLDLDDPVATHVAGVPNGDQVTLRELAAMTSGLPEYTTQRFLEDLLADPDRLFRPQELLDYAWQEPLQGPAGADAVYTNTNTVLLGRVVEAVSGNPFAVELKRRILRPLGLRHTLATPDERLWPEPHPVGYELENGVPTPQLTNLSIYAAAGEMVARFGDLRRWAVALGKGSLLEPATQAERLEGAQPLQRGPEYDRYGLGIGELSGWWGHTGEGLGFTALVMYEPLSEARAVIVMNTAGLPEGHPPTLLFRRVAELLERRGITGRPRGEQEAGPLPRGRLDGALQQLMDELGVPGTAAGVWVPGVGRWRRFRGAAVLPEEQGGGDTITGLGAASPGGTVGGGTAGFPRNPHAQEGPSSAALVPAPPFPGLLPWPPNLPSAQPAGFSGSPETPWALGSQENPFFPSAEPF
ncbi:MAG: serine hydrolase domain-containing protein [Synechococcus sp.]|nr:serine hydrolase domain-containing protein [Synechococcus sp.]